ncbi:MAG: hypothetical protein KJN77_04505 [Gammaproteobacteria bacterium]|nr:hypothetical protein [Gammaproteobacteria bacterium]
MRDNQFDRAIHFAMTSHGLGHITRSLAVLEALHEAVPSCSFFISSTISPDWIRDQLKFEVHCRHRGYEPGAIQRNCFEVDVEATLQAYLDFRADYPSMLEDERRFLRSQPFVGVISDIPALALRAASDVGIPGIGVSNFTWDWILEPWCESEYQGISSELQQDYATGYCQLCLPFGPSRSSFPRWEPAPLLSRVASKPRDEVRRLLELSTSERIAVVCPGGWDADDWPAFHARPGDFQLVTVNDLPITSGASCRRLAKVLPFGISMPDLIAAADVVLGKPGYGLASECVTHQVPFAMIERPNFRETPVLTAEMARMGRCSSMSIEQFFSGDWEDYLEGAIAAESDWAEIDSSPAKSIASRILQILAVGH